MAQMQEQNEKLSLRITELDSKVNSAQNNLSTKGDKFCSFSPIQDRIVSLTFVKYPGLCHFYNNLVS